ncbi:MAG: hypothetical protein SFV81_17630 [Pirellulaceae bacterium]|nr:hypothetical protein [Pirellulaceae bacterium]
MSAKSEFSRNRIAGSVLIGGLLLLTGLVGCGKGKDPWEVTHPATGVVNFKGRPIVDAELTFFPEDKSAPDSVRPKAKSTAGGKFEVWTYVQGDGAPAGNYKVTVVHNEVAVSKDTIVAKPNDLPEKFSKRDTTDIQVQIVAGKNEIPSIDIK